MCYMHSIHDTWTWSQLWKLNILELVNKKVPTAWSEELVSLACSRNPLKKPSVSLLLTLSVTAVLLNYNMQIQY